MPNEQLYVTMINHIQYMIAQAHEVLCAHHDSNSEHDTFYVDTCMSTFIIFMAHTTLQHKALIDPFFV